MPGEDPGGEGDPYITRIDGERFRFGGEPGKLYDLLSTGRVHAIPRIAAVPGDAEGRTMFSGLDVVIDGVGKVVVFNGQVHVIVDGVHIEVENKYCRLDAWGHHGDTMPGSPPELDEHGHQLRRHPLDGVEHLNLRVRALPDDPDATGLVVDGTADGDPARYERPEPD